MSDRRIGLIRDLEAHYGRWLRNAVMSNLGDIQRIAEERPDEAHPFSRIARWVESPVKIAIEGAAALNAVRMIEDDDALDVFVRWKTLPSWRKALEEQGWTLDEKNIVWSHPEHGKTFPGH